MKRINKPHIYFKNNRWGHKGLDKDGSISDDELYRRFIKAHNFCQKKNYQLELLSLNYPQFYFIL